MTTIQYETKFYSLLTSMNTHANFYLEKRDVTVLLLPILGKTSQ